MRRVKKVVAIVLATIIIFGGCSTRGESIIGEWCNGKGEVLSVSSEGTWKITNGLGSGTWESTGDEKYLFVDKALNEMEVEITKDEKGEYIDLAYYGKFYNNLKENQESDTESTIKGDSIKNYTITKTYQTYDGVGLINYIKNDGSDMEYIALVNLEGDVFHFSHDALARYVHKYEDGIGYYTYNVNEESYIEIFNGTGKGILSNQNGEFDEILALGNGMALLYRYHSTVDSYEHQYAIINSKGDFVFPWTALEMYKGPSHLPCAKYIGENIFSVYISYDNDYMLLNAMSGKVIYLYNAVPNHNFAFSEGRTYISSYNLVLSFSPLDYPEKNGVIRDSICLNTDGTYTKAQKFDFYTGGRAIKKEKDGVIIYNVNDGTTTEFTEYSSQIMNIEFYDDIGIVTICSADRKEMYFTAIDSKGNKLFEPIKYNKMSYSEGIFFYKVGETYKIANLKGEVLAETVPVRETSLEINSKLYRFDNGILATDGDGGYVNTKGEEIVVNFKF